MISGIEGDQDAISAPLPAWDKTDHFNPHLADTHRSLLADKLFYAEGHQLYFYLIYDILVEIIGKTLYDNFFLFF